MSKNHLSLFVLMAILLCFAINPVSATIETETLSTSLITSVNYANTVSNGANTNYAFIPVKINYDTVGEARYLTYYCTPPSVGISESGTFSVFDASGVIGSGTYQAANGTFTGLGTQYMFLNFASWNIGSRTGVAKANISFSGSYASVATSWQGANFQISHPDYQFIFNSPPLAQEGLVIGNYYYTTYGHADNTYTFENLTPLSPTGSVKISVLKTGDPTRTKIFSFSSLSFTGFTSTDPETIVVIGTDITAQMFCPATGGTSNTSVHFPLTPVSPGNVSNQLTKTFFVKDSVSNSLIGGSSLDIFNNNLASWTNQTSVSGSFLYTANLSEVISPYASAPGYKSSGYVDFLWTNDTTPITIALDRTNTSADINSTVLNVHVYDATNNAPLSNVFVQPANTTYPPATQVEYTNAAGLATLYLRNGTYYSVTASGKTGYIDQTVFVTTNANTQSLNILMQRITAPPTPTYTVPTTSPTGVIPTQTGGTGGNYTGFWGPIANGLQGAGALPSEIGILLTAMLIFVGFCVGGWSGRAYDPAAMFNAPGSVVGGVFGLVLSVAFGFIPLVYVIGLVLLCAFGWLFLSRMG